MKQKSSLFEELKRRNVFRVSVAYLVTAWVLLQIADLVLQNIHAPEWVIQAFMLALGLGFPVAVIFAWAFELTPEGIKKEKDVDRTQSITSRTGRKLDFAIIGVLAVAVVFLLLDRFSPGSGEDTATNVSESIDNAATQTSAIPASEANVIPANNTSVIPAQAGIHTSAKSIAVLPFTVMSTGPDDEYFADGLTEEIINALSQLPELMVTARTSAFHFKGQNVPIGDIAAKLGVANVVEGSVRRAGDQLRITAQLIRAEDGFHLWSESYDRRTEDTFAVQQDIAEKVATALNVLLDENQRQRMQQAGLKNVEAFIAYQKGMELFTRAHKDGVDISLLRQGNQMFELVSAAVPGFGRAYIQHSDLFTHILISQASGQLDGNITQADIETAPVALRNDYDQAVRNARDEGERLIAEADRALLLGEWRGLNSLSERALQVPGCEAALWAQLTSAPFGHAKIMQDAFARMAVCDPLDIRAQVHLSRSYLWLAEPQRAQEVAERGLLLGEHHMLAWTLFMALATQGDFGGAEQAINSYLPTGDERLYALSVLAAMQGNFERAEGYQNEFLGSNGPDDQASLVMEASRGNRNEANRLATLIDGRPFGYLALMQAIYACTCGAPFDLEATAVFAGLLAESGLAWPPVSPIKFPLKDW